MCRFLPIILILLSSAFSYGQQNQMLNGNFEAYHTCPSLFSQIGHCTGWRQYTAGNPDFFNACTGFADVAVPTNFFGYQYPASGRGYAGIYVYDNAAPDYKEYMVTKITKLAPNVQYEVSMSVNMADSMAYATNDIGAFFHKDGPPYIFTSGTLNVTPQISYTNYPIITDTQNWVRLVDTFVADSAYEHIVIGGFIRGSNQVRQKIATIGEFGAYYYIDSVVVIAIDTLGDPNDTSGGNNNNLPDSVSITIDDSTVGCAGKTILVNLFYRLDTTFTPDNIFSVLLSDNMGDFTNSAKIGSIKSTKPGKITCVLPPGLLPGTQYKLKVTSTSPEFTWNYPKDITIVAGPDLTTKKRIAVCPGATIQLYANAANEANYLWTGPDFFESGAQFPSIPNASASNEGVYSVTATLNGCSVRDTVNVSVACGVVELPGAFSPNGDGINDLLFARSNGDFKELDFRIYNRWGQLVFQTNDGNIGWDGSFNGQKLPPDVYGYTISGSFTDDSPFQKTGNITILK